MIINGFCFEAPRSINGHSRRICMVTGHGFTSWVDAQAGASAGVKEALDKWQCNEYVKTRIVGEPITLDVGIEVVKIPASQYRKLLKKVYP